MTTNQPETLAQECADYATSLRSTINVVKLEGREPPISFLRAAELFERAAARIAELEAARFAYASEFAPNSDGEPDVGSIHANIRALRTLVASLQAQMEAICAGGVGPLRKRECLHKISEPARPVFGLLGTRDIDVAAAQRAWDAAQAPQEAPDVVAYLIKNSERSDVRAVRLHVDQSCQDMRAQTFALMTVNQHEHIVSAVLAALAATPNADPAAPAKAGEYPELGSGSLWRDKTGIRGYGADPGNGPWYTTEDVHKSIDADRAACGAVDWKAGYKHGAWAAQAAPEKDCQNLQDLTHALRNVDELHRQVRLLEQQVGGEVWRWESSSNEDLKSMGNEMGVLIYACDLRALLAAQAAPVDAADLP